MPQHHDRKPHARKHTDDVKITPQELADRLSRPSPIERPKSFCPLCDSGNKVLQDNNGYFHGLGFDDPPCGNYDTEWVHYMEPLGKPHYAWLPRVGRNGAWHWLVWLEHHADGTYTLPMEPILDL